MHRAAGGTIHRLKPGLAMVRLGSRKPEMPPDAPACAAVIVISFLLQIFYSQQQTFLALRVWCALVHPSCFKSRHLQMREQASTDSPMTQRSRLLNHTFGFDRSALSSP